MSRISEEIKKTDKYTDWKLFPNEFSHVLYWCSSACSDDLHNTDTEFDGELINFAIQKQIQIHWKLIPY